MLVKDLDGPLLDYWVAKAEGREFYYPKSDHQHILFLKSENPEDTWPVFLPAYSRDWAACGPLIEKYELEVLPVRGNGWSVCRGSFCSRGNTPTQAICRAVVVGKYGDEVPDEIE